MLSLQQLKPKILKFLLLSFTLVNSLLSDEGFKMQDKFIVRKVVFIGNEKTKSEIIARELSFSVGSEFDTSKIEYNENRVYGTGLFNKVKIWFERDSTGSDSVDVYVWVNETKLNESRRKFLRTALVGVSAYAFTGSTIGTIARNDFRIEKVRIKIQNLPEELKGLTIGLISDVHSGIFMTEEDMQPYCEALNSLEPDLILMPGDFITSDPDEIYPFINVFKNLKSKYGIFATLGNHEFFPRQPQRIAKIIEENGIRVLRNENEKVEINGEELFIIGIDDLRYGADLDKAMKNVKNEKVKILLSHKPYDFPRFAQNQIQLTVSGHTHGGQIVFAKIDDTYITPSALVSKFVAGHYKLGNSHLYVTRGIGVVGLPLRLNCPAEITHITLV